MNNYHTRSLFKALGISGGIVCAVGAGGKKSLLYALAVQATGRTALTTTVKMRHAPEHLQAHTVIDSAAALQKQLGTPGGDGLFVYACPSDKADRWAGVATETVTTIHYEGRFGLTLVKADGARMRGIKAPKPGEPVLPPDVTTIVPVVSAAVLGQPLDERVAHRPELLAKIIKAKVGTKLVASHIARLLASENGALQGTDGVRVVPVINQVDNSYRHATARLAAETALSLTPRFDRILLTCLRNDAPVVDIITPFQNTQH